MELIFAELIFADFVQIAKISAAKFFQNQPSAKISSENFFNKIFVFKIQDASKIRKALDAGKLSENIEVPLWLSRLKVLHASWVVKLYGFLMSERGHDVIKNGWKASAVCQR